MPPPTLAENLAEERDDKIPDSELGPTRIARRRFMRGVTLNARTFADEYHCSTSVITQVVFYMKVMGFRFEKTEGHLDGIRNVVVWYRLINPDHAPSTKQFRAVAVATTKRKQKTAESTTTSQALVEAERSELPRRPDDGSATVGSIPLPGLDQQLAVYAIARDLADGTITVGMANGSRTWLFKLVGTAER